MGTYTKTISALKKAGLRPTRQRMALYQLLFTNGHRHVCAEDLYEEANKKRIHISLATVYNTLHQFRDAGLLQEVKLAGNKTLFDTNTDHHHHFHRPAQKTLIDIPEQDIRFEQLPNIPDGCNIKKIGVTITLD